MLVLLSPAKKLLAIKKMYSGKHSVPLFVNQTNTLAHIMKTKSKDEIASLMDLSVDLASLNYERYQHYYLENPPADVVYPAVLLFQGDVYQGLQAGGWSDATLNYAQEHLAILSGLYGALRPLDMIQPYRLEMGVRLSNPLGATLYDFWRDTIIVWINERLEKQKNPLLVNLASTEYFNAVAVKKLKYPLLTINFYEHHKGQLKIIGIHAKKARGAMAKYLMEQSVDDVNGIKTFNELGYTYDATLSSANQLAFVR